MVVLLWSSDECKQEKRENAMSEFVEYYMRNKLQCSYFFYDYDKQYALSFGCKSALLQFLESYFRFTDTDTSNYEAIVTLYDECGLYDNRFYSSDGRMYLARIEIYRIANDGKPYCDDMWYEVPVTII